MNNFLLAFLIILNFSLIILIFLWKKGIGDAVKRQQKDQEINDQLRWERWEERWEQSNRRMEESLDRTRQEIVATMGQFHDQLLNQTRSTIKTMAEMMDTNQKASGEAQDKRLAELGRRFTNMAMENEQKLEAIRGAVEKNMRSLQEDNAKQLEEIRHTVDEKLQKTLEDRISKSFQLVNERLEQVYKGLGEMQHLASGVGDLKKVLSNIKTRGILGEIQLGAILEQILSPEQYEENVKTKPGGAERVEFAVKLPGEDDQTVYLPIDAKFPGDAYAHLMDAYEAGDKEAVEKAGKLLEKAIEKSAKDIRDKYVEPPSTTEFAIMFLPFEGLYAEVVRRGLVEKLQGKYKVNVAGPTTMAALLNSLQMGFKTLAIQKHSSEVWDTLAAVKTEFGRFEDVLEKARQKMDQAGKELDTLVGTRTKMMNSKLKRIGTVSMEQSKKTLGLEDVSYDEE